MARLLARLRFVRFPLSHRPEFSPGLASVHRGGRTSAGHLNPILQVSRSYARERTHYNLFGNRRPGDEEFRKAWAEEMDEDDCLWTASEDDEKDNEKDSRNLERAIKKIRKQAKENSDLIDGDESDELRSLCSESDEEVALWSGSEDDDDDDIPTESHANERSDKHIDKLFEFEETPKYRTISELLKAEKEPPELSPGKQARKLAVENALKKLKKGPDGRYINVWEVMSDIDILIGAFENIVSGPEYAELREGGPKKLNMQFFKDIQARMRDPNFKFSPELKLKPKSKFVPRKKWQKAQARRRKNEKTLTGGNSLFILIKEWRELSGMISAHERKEHYMHELRRLTLLQVFLLSLATCQCRMPCKISMDKHMCING